MEVQVWYTVPVACHVDTDTGEVTRVVVLDEMIKLDTDLDALRSECDYSPDEDCSVDALIAYKDALEDTVPAEGVTLADYSAQAPRHVHAAAIAAAESQDWPRWEYGY